MNLILLLAAAGAVVSGDFTSWTWVAGSSVPNAAGSYGARGIPGISNAPGARRQAAMWSVADPVTGDPKLFMFSGTGYGFSSVDGVMTDMWTFDIKTRLWTWILGAVDFASSVGRFESPKGTFDELNLPNPRISTCTFVYKSELYLYGGFGYVPSEVLFGDLWKFNVSLLQWAWVSGSSANDATPVYGTYREGNFSNMPGGRASPTCWPEVNGMFYLFGGLSRSVSGNTESVRNDLWKFDITNNIWTWIHGSTNLERGATIGLLGIPGISDTPNANFGALGWAVDSHLYLGMGTDASGFWKFDLNSLMWTCLQDARATTTAIRSAMGVFSTSNYPGVRYTSATWKTLSGRLMLFGGLGNDDNNLKGPLNDVWVYDINLKAWAWVLGSTLRQTGATFGPLGESSSSFSPPGLFETSFVEGLNTDDYYMFGGWLDLRDGVYRFNYSNALWSLSSCSITFDSERGYVDCFGCITGQYYSEASSSCFNCPTGKYSDQLAQISESTCLPCGAGKYSGLGSSTCHACLPGSFTLSEGSSSCVLCPQGTYSGANESIICTSCDPGRFAESGSSLCLACSIGTFSSGGEGKCASCPDFSRTIGPSSTSVLDCFCEEGFWGKSFLNKSCQICPLTRGLSCPQNSTIPKIANGYFRDQEDPSIAYPCIPSSACAYTEEDTICAEGYAGFLCGECMQFEYYRRGLECIQCPSVVQAVILSILIVATIAFIGYRIMKTNFEIPVDLKIAIYWIQIISLFGDLSDSWPQSLQVLFHITSFSNVNIELFSPECRVAMNFWTKSYITLSFPFIFSAFISVAYLTKYKILPMFFETMKSQNMPTFRTVASTFLFLMSVIYATIVSAALSVFNCKGDENKRVLVNAPTVACFQDPEWKRNVAPMTIFALIYALGFPLFLAFHYWKNRKDISNPKFVQTFNPLIRSFQPKLFYWELGDLARKAFFVFLNDFLVNNSSQFTKVFVTVSFLFFWLVIEILLKPYKLEGLNNLNFLWSITSIVLLLSDGLIFSLDEVTAAEKRIFSVFMILLLTGTFAFSIHQVVLKLILAFKNGKNSNIVETNPSNGVIIGNVKEEDDPAIYDQLQRNAHLSDAARTGTFAFTS